MPPYQCMFVTHAFSQLNNIPLHCVLSNVWLLTKDSWGFFQDFVTATILFFCSAHHIHQRKRWEFGFSEGKIVRILNFDKVFEKSIWWFLIYITRYYQSTEQHQFTHLSKYMTMSSSSLPILCVTEVIICKCAYPYYFVDFLLFYAF